MEEEESPFFGWGVPGTCPRDRGTQYSLHVHDFFIQYKAMPITVYYYGPNHGPQYLHPEIYIFIPTMCGFPVPPVCDHL